MSYLKANLAILLDVQSRYSLYWQDSQSYWFEKEVADFLGVKHVHYVNTGTNALVCILQGLGIGPGDEVVVQTYTWVATASAVMANGAHPVLADIDETLGMNPEALRKVITNRTKAVIVTHMTGTPVDVPSIKAVTDEFGLYLVEDCAQAFGSSVHGKFTGKWGIAGFTSVGPVKPFNTAGNGGLTFTSDDELDARIEWCAENGLAVWGGKENLPSYKRSFGSTSEKKEVTPYATFCMRSPSEWHAAYGRSELTYLASTIKTLVELKMTFKQALKPQYQKLLQREVDPKGDFGYTVYLILPKEEHVGLLTDYLSKSGCKCHPGWAAKQHYLPNLPYLLNKVSYHHSGFPWVTKEDQKPIPYETYNKSHRIIDRVFQMRLSYYYTKPMMKWIARKFNDGLDEIMATCSASETNSTACYA